MSGRPTLCNEATTEAVVGHIADGLSNRDAAALAGISESAFYEWLQRGNAELERVASNSRASIRASEAPFVEFTEAVKKAVPERKRQLLRWIRMDMAWQSKAWLLERLHPEEFGPPKQRIEQEGDLTIRVVYDNPDR